jgi:hypothetical protein
MVSWSEVLQPRLGCRAPRVLVGWKNPADRGPFHGRGAVPRGPRARRDRRCSGPRQEDGAAVRSGCIPAAEVFFVGPVGARAKFEGSRAAPGEPPARQDQRQVRPPLPGSSGPAHLDRSRRNLGDSDPRPRARAFPSTITATRHGGRFARRGSPASSSKRRCLSPSRLDHGLPSAPLPGIMFLLGVRLGPDMSALPTIASLRTRNARLVPPSPPPYSGANTRSGRVDRHRARPEALCP